MKTSIIMVNYDGGELTCRALESIRNHEPGCEVIVVDNGSADDSLNVISARFPEVLLIPLGRNTGFGHANNEGAKRAGGETLFFLNNDAYLTGPVISRLADVLQRDEQPGVCGARLENDDGSFQLSTGNDPSLLGERRTRKLQYLGPQVERWVHQGEPLRVDWVTGAALMIPAKLFRELGGFDDGFFMYFEDADLCRRVRSLGRSVWYVPDVTIRHSRGGSADGRSGGVSVDYRRSQMRYYRKHNPIGSQSVLRLYLIVKFSVLWLMSEGGSERRKRASDLLHLAVMGGRGVRHAA